MASSTSAFALSRSLSSCSVKILDLDARIAEGEKRKPTYEAQTPRFGSPSGAS